MPMEYPGLVTYYSIGIGYIFTSLFSIQTTNTLAQFSLGDSKIYSCMLLSIYIVLSAALQIYSILMHNTHTYNFSHSRSDCINEVLIELQLGRVNNFEN